MKDFLQVVDYELWNRIIDGPQYLMKKDNKNKDVQKEKNEYNEADYKMLGKNAKAKYILVCGLGLDEHNTISGCTTAKQIWYTLMNVYEKNTENFKKEKGTKDKSLKLKASNSEESDLDNKKLARNFNRFFKRGKGQDKKGTSNRSCSNDKTQTDKCD